MEVPNDIVWLTEKEYVAMEEDCRLDAIEMMPFKPGVVDDMALLDSLRSIVQSTLLAERLRTSRLTQKGEKMAAMLDWAMVSKEWNEEFERYKKPYR